MLWCDGGIWCYPTTPSYCATRTDRADVVLVFFSRTPDARQDNPQKALELFQKVVTLEAEKGSEIKW